MNKEGKSRRDHLTVSAVNPGDGRSWEVMISHDRVKVMGKRSKGAVLECAYLVPYALQHPTAIYEGLRWESDQPKFGLGTYCYCTQPRKAYRKDGSERNPYPGEVFLVFVNDERVAYNWRWEEADPNDPKLPKERDEDRFHRRPI